VVEVVLYPGSFGGFVKKSVIFFSTIAVAFAFLAQESLAQTTRHSRSNKHPKSELSQLGFDTSNGGQLPDLNSVKVSNPSLLAEMLNSDAAGQAGNSSSSETAPAHTSARARLADPRDPQSGPEQKAIISASAAEEGFHPVKAKKGKLSSNAVLFTELDSSLSRYGLLVPRQKGPFIDEGNPDLITGTLKWERASASSCSEPGNEPAFFSKSEALREILFRYTGSNEFYDSLVQVVCRKECGESAATPFVTGFAVGNARGGTFKIVTQEHQCYYQIARPASGEWVPLEGEKVICSCPLVGQ
jgi:hypothetical protein